MHTLEKVDALENPDSITLPLQKVPLGGDAGFWIDNDIRGMSLEQPGGAPEVGLTRAGVSMMSCSVLARMTLFSNFGAIKDLMSTSMLHRTAP